MLLSFTTPTQPAGSIGGLVLYKNGTQFCGRSRSRPTIVRSNASNVPKNLISVLSIFWEQPLTDAQRIAWGNYAYNTPLSDAYSNPRFIPGYAHYMRSNRPRLQHGLARVDDGPTTFGIPTYTLPTFACNFLARTVTVSVTNTDQWATETGAALLLWISRPTSPARQRPPETYQPLGRIDGDPTTPPTSQVFSFPSWIPIKPVFFWIRSSCSLADGRLSGL